MTRTGSDVPLKGAFTALVTPFHEDGQIGRAHV